MPQHTAGAGLGMLALGDHRGAVDDHVVHAGAVLAGIGKGGMDGQILQGKDVHVSIKAGKQNAAVF